MCASNPVLAVGADILDKQVYLSIDANSPLEDALIEWGAAAGVTVMINTMTVNGRITEGLKGTLNARGALVTLLRGSGLSYKLDGTRVQIVPTSTIVRSNLERDTSYGSISTSSDIDTGSDRSSDVAAQESVSAQPEKSVESAPREKSYAEVVVTAQKREERLIDTPQSVTSLDTDELSKLGVEQIRDFADAVPGLTLNTFGAGESQITLRGVTSGVGDLSATTAIYVDEVPYGGGYTFFTLDSALFDLDRIEVLRGPQGTLYGASSMGGLIKYVTKQPDPTRFSGETQAGVSTTEYGGVSYNVAEVTNIPVLPDKLAVRASAFESHDGGYIDNTSLGQSNVNRSDIYGGRLDVLISPVDRLNIRITGFLQNTSRAGQANADYYFSGTPVSGSLHQQRLVPEPLNQHFRLVSSTANYDFGAATLTSISAYQTVRDDIFFDESGLLVPVLNQFFGLAYSTIQNKSFLGINKFTQEVRLSSKDTKLLEWVIGGFYSHQNATIGNVFFLHDVNGQPAPNNVDTLLSRSGIDEVAEFGDVTLHPTARFDITGGLRYSRTTSSSVADGGGILGAGATAPFLKSADHVVTYLGTARYHFTSDEMLYLRYATGYRPGGPNFVGKDLVTGQPLGPPTYQSDSLKSYEVGYKTDMLDHRLGVDLALYDIEWNNIQTTTNIEGFTVVVNAPGGARIRGSEFTLTGRPTDKLTLTGALAYQDAFLKDAEPNIGGNAGERLPNVPRFTIAVNGDYFFQTPAWQPRVGATLRYVDARWASYDNAGNVTGIPQYHLPDYTVMDLHGGVSIGRSDIQLYIRNVFDKRAQLSAVTEFAVNEFGPTEVAMVQPRTVGITLTTRF